MDTNRRKLILASISLSVATLIPSLGKAVGKTHIHRRLLLRGALADLFSTPESARRIGVAYLSGNPAEDDSAVLENCALPSGRRLGTLVAEPDADRLRALIRREITQDFESGDTVMVEGWLLSRSEARLYALVSLSI